MSVSQVLNHAGGEAREITAYYTAKNINATNGSRSAISDDIQVGDVVVIDPYGFDGETNELNVTQPQTNFLYGRKYVVTSVPSEVNERTSSGATQRKGGRIKVCSYADSISCHVDGTTDIAVGDPLEVTNGSWKLTKQTTITFANCGVAQEAFTTNGEGTIACSFGNII